MKYSAAVAAFAAAGAYAQLSTIQTVLSDVSSNIDSLGSAANSFNGNVDSVKSKADSLVASIKKGISTVSGSQELDVTSAIGLTEPVQSLTKKGQALADGFKARITDVQKANACGTVRSSLSDINSNSQSLIKAVVGKVPQSVQSVAQELAGGLTKVLDQAQSDFSEQNCKDSGNSGSSSTAAASQTSAAATSATSAAATSSAAVTSAATTAGTTLVPIPTPAPGTNGTTGVPPPVTAGAAFLAPAGALVLAVAAALL